MQIFPAIDIKDGLVVRLTQGEFKKKTIYSKDPVKTALHWQKQGAKILHVVDLDGALKGKPVNLEVVSNIAKAVSIPVQYGGGVRGLDSIIKAHQAGISRVVLGTKAVQDKKFLETAFKKFGAKIIVSIDARAGMVLTDGWIKKAHSITAIEFAKELEKIGFSEVIYTDISKDGTLKGPDIKGIKALLKETGLKVIGSGGISNLDDLAKLKVLEKAGLIGIIVGKALYEGRFTLTQAIKIAG